MMQESLVRLQNLLTELRALHSLSKVILSSLVTLTIEYFFSLMRENDPMPTQLEYGTRRASKSFRRKCIVVISIIM